MQVSTDQLTARLRRLGEHHDRAHERARAAAAAHKALERPETGEAPAVAPEASRGSR